MSCKYVYMLYTSVSDITEKPFMVCLRMLWNLWGKPFLIMCQEMTPSNNCLKEKKDFLIYQSLENLNIFIVSVAFQGERMHAVPVSRCCK